MNCRAAALRIRSYVDGELGWYQRRLIRRHLLQCSECFEQYDGSEVVHDLVRDGREVTMPTFLRTRILLATSGAMRWSAASQAKLWLENCLRPLAVPAFGGVLSAMILFGALISHLSFVRGALADDIPLTYLTRTWIENATIMKAPELVVPQDITVEVFLDQAGRVYDLRMVKVPVAPPHVTSKLKSQVASALLTAKFAPATNFGRPVLGRVLLSFRPVTSYVVYG